MIGTSKPAGPGAELTPAVLVVDDDDALRLLVTTALSQFEFRVLEAADGGSALDVFNRERPDIVLLDVVMPGMNGFDVCSAIRAHNAGEHVPILMMTGLDDVESIDRAYNAGGTDFITKPVNYAVLPHRVRYMLRAAQVAGRLRESQARLDRAQRMARIGYWEWNLQSQTVLCSELVEQWFGVHSGSRIEGKPTLLEQVHEDDRERLDDALQRGFTDRTPVRLDYRVRHDGDILHLSQDARFAEAEDTGELCYTGIVQDISQRVEAEQAVHELRHFDEVTGLLNRFAMKQRVDQAINAAQRDTSSFAVLTLGIDNFSRVNDNLGHAAGDEVLREVGVRLVDCVRESDAGDGRKTQGFDYSDAVARLGGDEFMVLLRHISATDDASAVAQRIRSALSEPMHPQGAEIVVSASIGISTFPDNGESVDELIEHAGAALNAAKRDGRDRDQIYTATLDARTYKRFTMESNLRKALEEEQFELHYQPKIDALSGAVHGAEALIRWRHPDLGMIAPDEFIPVAEESGLIVPIGEWVIGAACRQLAAWSETALADLVIAVNLSAAQFGKQGLAQLLIAGVEQCGIAPARLELELTESVIMSELDATVALLKQLKAAGFPLWIDDFGTGYSSMSYLQALPIDGLKIDQSFIRNMHTNPADAAIARAVCLLAQGLELDIVAEGVERQEHAASLREFGCQYLQGFYFSAALPPAEFAAWVGAHETGSTGLSAA